MTNFTIKVRPDQDNVGVNKIEVFLDTEPKQEIMILADRGDGIDEWEEEPRPEDTALYYAVERIAELETRVKRLDDELQNRSNEDDMMASDAYHHCADMIQPYLGYECGADTLSNSVCESLRFLISEWKEKGRVEQERDASLEHEKTLAAHVERLREGADMAIKKWDRHPSYIGALDPIKDALGDTPATSLARHDANLIASLNFPTMLRKMWSGGEVAQWLNEQAEQKLRLAERVV